LIASLAPPSLRAGQAQPSEEAIEQKDDIEKGDNIERSEGGPSASFPSHRQQTQIH
jgi:hypothetical protein